VARKLFLDRRRRNGNAKNKGSLLNLDHFFFVPVNTVLQKKNKKRSSPNFDCVFGLKKVSSQGGGNRSPRVGQNIFRRHAYFPPCPPSRPPYFPRLRYYILLSSSCMQCRNCKKLRVYIIVHNAFRKPRYYKN